MAVINKGTLFPAALETELFSKVKGHSSLAMMSGQDALPFTGKDIFTFNFASDVSIVGESATKPAGDGVITPVSMQPVKVVYQMRVSDEFMTASDEHRVEILKGFADGFAKKLGAGLDKMAMHGINPATGSVSSLISGKSFDTLVTNEVTYDATKIDENIDDAVALIEAAEYTANGTILSPAARGAIAKLATDNGRKYPEFAFGATPANLGAMRLDTNATVSAANDNDRALVGDFSAFRWGIAKEIPVETIEYGNPDGQGDLKQYNQVLLRGEAFIGWAIMDPAAFARIEAGA